MSPFRAGVVAIAVLLVLSYFGFTKANPFAHPFVLHAVFANVNNLKPNSPGRIAGVDVGKVESVDAIKDSDGGGAARVTVKILQKGLPVHRDATVKVRHRDFLGGNLVLITAP